MIHEKNEAPLRFTASEKLFLGFLALTGTIHLGFVLYGIAGLLGAAL